MKNLINRALAAEKKLFLLLVAVVMTASVMAEGHMKFKGVEIDGTPQEFVKKLKDKGFTYIGKENGADMLVGDFAGFNQCAVGIVSFAGKVAKVAAVIPEETDSWNLLYGKYSTLKDMLTTKYGTPSIDKEEWQGYGGEPKDDNSRMHELLMNRVKIGCNFETPDGDIELTILSLNMQCAVMLTYYDAINYKAAVNSAIDDL